MGIVLIVVGLVISYLCWIQKKEIDYIEKKNHENKIGTVGTESILDRRRRIQTKLQNNEKLSFLEGLNWYSEKVFFFILKFGFYGGFVLSFIGLVMFISSKM